MKALVILNPSHREQPANDLTLLRRTVEFARATGSQVELLHVVHDSDLSRTFLRSEEKLEEARRQRLADESKWVRAAAKELAAQGVEVTCDVHWAHPRTEAILQKIDGGAADLVFKESNTENFVLGLMSNTDWDIIRQSPVPVWFVQGTQPVSAGIVVAIDHLMEEVNTGDEVDERSALDYDTFRCAQKLSAALAAPLSVVHAYQLPRGVAGFEAYAPAFGAEAGPLPRSVVDDIARREREASHEIAVRHGNAIQAFADFFAYPLEDILIREGVPHDVVAREAARRGSGLIVMGATERSKWARVLNGANAEPTLADAQCDVVFVRPRHRGDAASRRPGDNLERVRGAAQRTP